MAQSYVPLFTKILLETVIVTVLGITEIYLAFLPSSLFPLPQKKTSIRPTRSWKLTVEKYRPLFVALFLSFFFANHSLDEQRGSKLLSRTFGIRFEFNPRDPSLSSRWRLDFILKINR